MQTKTPLFQRKVFCGCAEGWQRGPYLDEDGKVKYANVVRFRDPENNEVPLCIKIGDYAELLEPREKCSLSDVQLETLCNFVNHYRGNIILHNTGVLDSKQFIDSLVLKRRPAGNSCFFCKALFDGMGNSTWPIYYKEDSEYYRCCDACNEKFVIAARKNRTLIMKFRKQFGIDYTEYEEKYLMLYLPFTFRASTQEEIQLFSEEFSNVYTLNPEVKFTTAGLHNENYTIFATKEENDETRVLFFLILDHPLKKFRNVYHLFCAFIKEVTHVEPKKENLGKSKRICWNLQEEKYHMYFEEVIYKIGGETSINSPHFYKDGLFVQYNYEQKAWKEKVNHVDRYYYEQKLSDYSEEEKTPEWYSDYEYACLLHFCETFPR